MKIEQALSEKYRVQKMLSESASDIHDYFERSHRAAGKAMAEIGATPNYSGSPQQGAAANPESVPLRSADSR